MSRDPRVFLFDAAKACDAIARFTAGLTLADYLADEVLRAAVERQFEIVGEALNAAARSFPDVAAMIDDLPRIVALRNRLAHSYATTSDDVVWRLVEVSVPVLREQIGALLETEQDRPR